MPTLARRAEARACALAAALGLAHAAAAAETTSGVITYPPSFFAAQKPANAAEMLARLPGFTVDDGASVRGFEGAAGNVLVDRQRPASKSDNLDAILARIPADRVERIEVIRGGAPGIDMQGKPVIANVITRRSDAPRGQLEANTSLVPDGRTIGGLDFQASGGREGTKWETSGTLGKGFSALLGDGVGEAGGSDRRAATRSTITTEDDGIIAQLTGAYERPIAGGKLKLNGLAFHGDTKLEETDVQVATRGVENTNEPYLQDQRELGATFTRPLSRQATLELVGLRQTGDIDARSLFTAPDGQQRFQNRRQTREDIARAVLKRSWGDSLSGEVGAEAAQNRLKSRSRFEINHQDVPLPAAHVRVQEDRAEAFVKASWRPSPRWSLDGQLRYERSTIESDGDVVLEKTLSYLKPRLLATWSIRPSTQVRLRIEREVGQLDFDAFVARASLQSDTGVTAGNPDLDPERAWVTEAAVEQSFLGRGALVLTATHAQVQDVVDRGPVFTPAGVFDRPENIGDGTRDMLKAELTLPLDAAGLKRAQLKGYVVRRWSQVTDPTTHAERRISAERPVEWQAKFSQDLPARNMTWGVELYGGWQQVYDRFNAVDAFKLDPFLMTYVEWRPRPDLNLRLELENITERGYRHTTTTYDGVRDAAGSGPAVYSDRNFHFGRIVYIRLRKTFGR